MPLTRGGSPQRMDRMYFFVAVYIHIPLYYKTGGRGCRIVRLGQQFFFFFFSPDTMHSWDDVLFIIYHVGYKTLKDRITFGKNTYRYILRYTRCTIEFLGKWKIRVDNWWIAVKRKVKKGSSLFFVMYIISES